MKQVSQASQRAAVPFPFRRARFGSADRPSFFARADSAGVPLLHHNLVETGRTPAEANPNGVRGSGR